MGRCILAPPPLLRSQSPPSFGLVSATGTDQAPLFPTIPNAAKRVPCSPRILRDARDRGELAVYRLGDRWQRVFWPEVVAWIRSRRIPVTNHARARVEEVLERERSADEREAAPG